MPESDEPICVIPLNAVLELAKMAGEIDGARMVVDREHHDPDRLAESMGGWSDRLEHVVDSALTARDVATRRARGDGEVGDGPA